MVVWDIQPPALWTKADGTPFWSADVTALFLMLYAREVIPMSFRTRLAMELIDPAVNRTHGDVSETRRGFPSKCEMAILDRTSEDLWTYLSNADAGQHFGLSGVKAKVLGAEYFPLVDFPRKTLIETASSVRMSVSKSNLARSDGLEMDRASPKDITFARSV